MSELRHRIHYEDVDEWESWESCAYRLEVERASLEQALEAHHLAMSLTMPPTGPGECYTCRPKDGKEL